MSLIEKLKSIFTKKIFVKSKSEKLSTFYGSLLVQDLDQFFRDIYIYYYLGGYKCIKTQIILDIIIYLFTMHFIMFIAFFIQWSSIFNLNSQTNNSLLNFTNIVNNTNKTIFNNSNIPITNSNITNEIIELSDFISFNFYKNHESLTLFIYILFMYYFISYFLASIKFINRMKYIHEIYKKKLYLHTKDLESISFNDIMNLLINLQNNENYCRVKETLTKFDIVSRIHRKKNYLTAIINFNIIDFHFYGIDLMTKYTYHFFGNNIMNFVFKNNETEITKNFYKANYLKLLMLIQLLFQIITMLPEICFKIAFFLFKNADKTSSNIDVIFLGNDKTWKENEQILFRNYNELKHHFKKRIYNSNLSTNKFISCFKQKILSIISYTIKLICGSILLLFFFITFFIDIKVTKIKIFNFNLISIAFIAGLIITIIKKLGLENENSGGANLLENYKEKNENFMRMVRFIENIPSNWDKKKIYKNYKKIAKVYVNKIYIFITEIISILFLPFIWIKLIKNINELITFVKYFSIELDGIGTVCSFSVPSFKNFKILLEKSNELLKNQDDRKFLIIKFFNSIFYFENNFCNDEEENIELKKVIKNNKEIETYNVYNDLNMVNNDELIELKILKNEMDLDNQFRSNSKKKILDVISGKIFEIYKGKISKDEIKENISYYMNIVQEINYDEILDMLYLQKYSIVNI